MVRRPHKSPSSLPPAVQAFLFVTGFLVVLYSVWVPYYFANDDTFIAMILRGVGFADHPSPWTIYLNILLGKFLQSLYLAAPQVAWYPWFLLIVTASSFEMLMSIGCSRAQDARSRWLLRLLLPAVFFPFLIRPHYSSVALLAALSGALAFVPAFGKKGGILTRVGGVLLIASAALLRWEAAVPGLMAAAPVVVLMWRGASPSRRPVPWKTLGAVALVLVIPWLADRIALHAHPEWRQAVRYARLRQELMEFKAVPYDERTAPVFQRAGWDRLDYEFFNSWYGGVGKFDLEHLESLNRDFSRRWPRPGFRFREFITQHSTVYFLSLFLLSGVWLSRKSLLRAGSVLAWTLAWMLLFILFFKLPERLAMAFWAFPVLVALLEALSQGPADSRRNGRETLRLLSLAGIGVVFLWSLVIHNDMERVFKDRETGFRTAVKDLPRDGKDLVVFWGNGIHVDWIRAFDDYRVLEGLNLYPVFWLQASPHAEAMRKRFRLEDPVRDLVDRPDVTLAPSDLLPWTLYQRVMRKKYGLNVEAVQASDGMGCRTYRVVTRKRGG